MRPSRLSLALLVPTALALMAVSATETVSTTTTPNGITFMPLPATLTNKDRIMAGHFFVRQVEDYNIYEIRSWGFKDALRLSRPTLPDVLFWPVICDGPCPPYQIVQAGRFSIYPFVVKAVHVDTTSSARIERLNGAMCPISAQDTDFIALTECFRDDINEQALQIGVLPTPIGAAKTGSATEPLAEPPAL